MTTQSTAPGLPDAAAVELVADPLAVAMVRKACAGYWLIHRADNAHTAAAIREAINTALGVTPQQREAMLAGSLFGWDCPAAHPGNYDESGNVCPVRDCPHDDTRADFEAGREVTVCERCGETVADDRGEVTA